MKQRFRDRVIHAVWLAGSGASASSIASDIGSKPEQVYSMLRRYRVPLLPKTPGEVGFPIVIRNRSLERVTAFAAMNGYDPKVLIGKLVDACSESPDLMRNLLDEGDSG